MKKIFTVALLGATLLYAESSAFGAGDITSNSSYGLTSNVINPKINLNQVVDGLALMMK